MGSSPIFISTRSRRRSNNLSPRTPNSCAIAKPSTRLSDRPPKMHRPYRRTIPHCLDDQPSRGGGPLVGVLGLANEGEAVGDRHELVGRGELFRAKAFGEKTLDCGHEGAAPGEEH